MIMDNSMMTFMPGQVLPQQRMMPPNAPVSQTTPALSPLMPTLQPQPQVASQATMAYGLGQLMFGAATYTVNLPKTLHREGVTGDEVRAFRTAGFRPSRALSKDVDVVVPAMAERYIEVMQQAAKKGQKQYLPAVVGYDTRESSYALKDYAAQKMTERGIDVFMAPKPLSTPVASFMTRQLGLLVGETDFDRKNPGITIEKSSGAVVLTASHNPFYEGGVKGLNNSGVNAGGDDIKRFGEFQSNPMNRGLGRAALGLTSPAQVYTVDPYPKYFESLSKVVDFKAIKDSGVQVVLDTQYGAGFPFYEFLRDQLGADRVTGIRTEPKPTLEMIDDTKRSTEPKPENLEKLSAEVRAAGGKKVVGLALDGDADRFAVVDEEGKMVSISDVLALALQYLMVEQGKPGTLVRTDATTHYLDALYEKYAREKGIQAYPVEVTPVGFKDVGRHITQRHNTSREVILGAESSGGATSGYHVAWEKDGLFMDSAALGALAASAQKTGRTVSQTVEAMRNEIPEKFAFQELGYKGVPRKPKDIDNSPADQILLYFEQLLQQPDAKIGGMTIQRAFSQSENERLKDGVFVYLEDDNQPGKGSWFGLRISGTENPENVTVRLYVEGVASRNPRDTSAAANAAANAEAMLKKERIKYEVDRIVEQIVPGKGFGIKNPDA
jgi:phosphomannomutase